MSARNDVRNENYAPAVIVTGEGLRFGMVSCLRCGAALILDPEFDTRKIHDGWHEWMDSGWHQWQEAR